MSLAIRAATRADLPTLLAIERESFVRPHWEAEDFLKAGCLVAELDGEIAGMLVARQTFFGDTTQPPEREILNLAVARRFRRRGIATALLEEEMSRKAVFFLEVRESNTAAQQLYRKFGFMEIGYRPNYYQSPLEGAIVMQMK